MAMRPAPVTFALLLVALATYASLTQGSSGGLNANGAEPKNGCTCHCATQDSGVTAKLEGLPTEWEAAKAYALTVSFTGGATIKSPAPNNQGGFALQVTHGTFAAKDDKAQVKDLDGGKKFATHTSAGNDQTSWDLTWTAPSNGVGEVTFWLATNNVNGDGTNGNGTCTDNWGKIERKVGEKPAPEPEPDADANGTEPQPQEGGEEFGDDFEGGNETIPNQDDEGGGEDKGFLAGFEGTMVAAAFLAALVVARRRTR